MRFGSGVDDVGGFGGEDLSEIYISHGLEPPLGYEPHARRYQLIKKFLIHASLPFHVSLHA